MYNCKHTNLLMYENFLTSTLDMQILQFNKQLFMSCLSAAYIVNFKHTGNNKLIVIKNKRNLLKEINKSFSTVERTVPFMKWEVTRILLLQEKTYSVFVYEEGGKNIYIFMFFVQDHKNVPLIYSLLKLDSIF